MADIDASWRRQTVVRSFALVTVVGGVLVGVLGGGATGAAVGALIAITATSLLAVQLRTVERSMLNSTRRVHALALGAGLLALIVMGEIVGLLEFMRLVDTPARSINFITTTHDEQALTDAVAGFREFHEMQPATRDARQVIWWFAGIDSIAFVWAYGIVLARIVQRRLDKGGVPIVDADGVVSSSPASGPARRLLVFAHWALLVTIAADWLENLSVAALVQRTWDATAAGSATRLLMEASTLLFAVKWVAVALLVAMVVMARLISGAAFFGTGDGTIREATKRLRPLVAVYLTLLAVLFQPLQTSDLMLSLGDGGTPLLWMLVAVLALSVTLWSWARHLQASAPRLRSSLDDTTILVIGGCLLALGGVLTTLGWNWIAMVPGAIVAVVGLTGRLLGLGDAETDLTAAEQEPVVGASYLPAVLAGGVMVVVGAAMIRAGVADTLFVGADGAEKTTSIGAVLVAAGVFLPAALRWLLGPQGWIGMRLPNTQPARVANALLLINVVLAAIVVVGLRRDAVETARHFGALALVLIALAVAAGGSAKLVRWADTFRPPTVFTAMHARRIPIFSALGLWFVVGLFALDRTDHDVRDTIRLESVAIPAECMTTPPVAPKIDEAWRWWTITNGLAAEEPGEDAGGSGDDGAVDRDGRTGYPLVLVAASGGGVRAAWWTAAVMGEMIPEMGPACIDTEPTTFDGRQIFVASGVSGGSLGLATHQAAMLAGVELDDRAGWVEQRLGVDHLSPALAWFAYVEVPRSLLGFPWGDDRAAVMEKSWEATWNTDDDGLGVGLRAGWVTAPQLPMLALNGTAVNDGCRVLTSVLDIGGDPADCRSTNPTGELHETYSTTGYLCDDRDLRLSTSALLSARFPLISPAGRLESCDGENAIEVVDGGYRDGNGAETAVDLLARIAPLIDEYNDAADSEHCIVPVYVLVEDDFRLREPSSPGGSWPPLLAPAEAILAANGSGTGEADAEITTIFPEDRRIRIGPTAAPGAHPALGWSLSDTTRSKMIDQVVGHPEIDQLRDVVGEILATPCTDLT